MLDCFKSGNLDLEEVISLKNRNIIKQFEAINLKKSSSENKIKFSSLLTRHNITQNVLEKPSLSKIEMIDTTANMNPSSDMSLDVNTSKKESYLTQSGKPPNVLIYTGSDEAGNRKFEDAKSILLQCLTRDRYAIYHLRQDQVTAVPWIENTILLVLVAKEIPQNGLCDSFLTYFFNGGTVVSLSSNFDESFLKLMKPQRQSEIIRISYQDFDNISVIGCSTCYDSKSCYVEDGISMKNIATNADNGGQIIVLAKHKQSSGAALLSLVSFEEYASNKALSDDQFVALKLSNASRINIFRDILSKVGLNCSQSDPLPLSPLIFFGTSQKFVENFFSSLKATMKGNVYSGREISYDFVDKQLSENVLQKPTEAYLPVIRNNIQNGFQCEFDFETYKKYLETVTLGNVVFYGSVVSTTMTIIEDFMNYMPSDVGLVAIASSQTAGIGRGGNVWLSPKGCGMFSLHIRMSLDSPLGNCISCFQQLVALASILAVKRKKGYENVDLRIKWPNDIYYGDKLKLGGVLIKSSIFRDNIFINLGCGVNITNRDPTTCLNDILVQHNNSHPNDHLQLFTVEEFVARFITQIELLMRQFQEDFGNSFYDLYHQHWLHSNQEVNLYKSDGPKGKILGITREGYLLVRLEDGHLVEVHPDGNSFDMMKNLIISKLQR